MFKFLRPALFLLGLSVLCSSLSYLYPFSRTFESLANLTFSDLSHFVDNYDKKIAELHLNRIDSLGVNYQYQKYTDIQNAFVPNKDLQKEVDETIKEPQNVKESVLAEGLRLLLKFLLLHIVTLIIFCIILLQYGYLFREMALLLLKLLRKCNWMTPIRIVFAFLRLGSWITSLILYYNSFIPVKTRLLVYPVLTCAVATVSFKVGIGRKHMLNMVPLVIGFLSYFAIVLTFNSVVHATNKFLLNELVILVWILFTCFRYFGITKVGTGFKIRKERTESVKFSHEVSCLLELCALFVLAKMLKSLPIMGPVWMRKAYLTHFVSFFTVVAIVHCIIVYVADIEVNTGTPLSRVRVYLTKTLDNICLQVFGLPNLISGRIKRKDTIPSKLLKRLKSMLYLTFGNFMEPLYKNEKVRLATEFSKALPQLVLLCMPEIVSRLYFNYCTIIRPTLQFLTLDESNLKEKVLAIILLVTSEVARSVINSAISHKIAFKTIQRTIILIHMDHTMAFLNNLM